MQKSSKPIRFKLRNGCIHIGYLTNIKGSTYHISDILDGDITIKREDVESLGGVKDGFNTTDYETRNAK